MRLKWLPVRLGVTRGAGQRQGVSLKQSSFERDRELLLPSHSLHGQACFPEGDEPGDWSSVGF